MKLTGDKMLYSMFLYQKQTGFSIWERSFDSHLDPTQLQIYSSFFSAIQGFIKQIVDGGDSSLNYLDLGNIFLQATPFPDIQLELVTIADSKDKKAIKKFHGKMKKILLNHKVQLEIHQDKISYTSNHHKY